MYDDHFGTTGTSEGFFFDIQDGIDISTPKPFFINVM